MPRFSLKTLFLSTSLIALGVWISLAADSLVESAGAFALWILSGGIVGAGIGLPFKHAVIGATIGIAFIIAMFFYILLNLRVG